MKWSEKWHCTTAMAYRRRRKNTISFFATRTKADEREKIDIKRKQEIFLLLPFLESRHRLSICCRPKNYLNDTDVHWFSPIYSVFIVHIILYIVVFNIIFSFSFTFSSSLRFVSFLSKKWQLFLIQPDVLGNWVFRFESMHKHFFAWMWHEIALSTISYFNFFFPSSFFFSFNWEPQRERGQFSSKRQILICCLPEFRFLFLFISSFSVSSFEFCRILC